jgi:hypothetical protein
MISPPEDRVNGTSRNEPLENAFHPIIVPRRLSLEKAARRRLPEKLENGFQQTGCGAYSRDVKTTSARPAKSKTSDCNTGAGTPLPDDPPFLVALLKLAKKRSWPRDFAVNYSHYSKGLPRK